MPQHACCHQKTNPRDLLLLPWGPGEQTGGRLGGRHTFMPAQTETGKALKLPNFHPFLFFHQTQKAPITPRDSNSYLTLFHRLRSNINIQFSFTFVFHPEQCFKCYFLFLSLQTLPYTLLQTYAHFLINCHYMHTCI